MVKEMWLFNAQLEGGREKQREKRGERGGGRREGEKSQRPAIPRASQGEKKDSQLRNTRTQPQRVSHLVLQPRVALKRST